MTDSHGAQIAELKDDLERLEKVRRLLGDDTVDAKQREIESKIAALIQTSGGTVVAGSVATEGGDFVGRDQLAAQGGRSVVIGGGAPCDGVGRAHRHRER